ncbi:TPM domain-containing protein [Sphingomonas canadensis]|uniref:TPM domain-containing protein n=1 Tax=Sphingomonas canadensis TaxID=1219257 RepID=A0ABW3H5T8_9SPHN|nr:hypothetical protein [Sphingomonas canadensis]MCW3834577.1 hypothetical protein [Sphingomonas canadensis]
MAGFRFTPEQHAQVTAAVAAAEETTDGEIVTIVAGRSDSYHDVGLHYAIGAMLLLIVAAAVFPGLIDMKLAWFGGGWHSEESVLPTALFLLAIGQTIVFLIVRYGLAWMPLRMLLTPGATKTRRVRRRALQFFRTSAEKRTVGRVGVLLYLSLREHRAEIIADEAIHSKVAPERWGEAMAALIDQVRAGDPAAGMAEAVTMMGSILAEHFPKTGDDINELPDRLIEL